MSIQVKFRRGTTTQHNSFTGADGEITVDSTIKTLRVHDGATVGGIRLAKYSEIGTATQYLQVANATALYTTKAYAAANSYVKSTLANTNSYIATKLNTTTFNSALANTNSYIVARASWSALTATNTAIRVLISDRLQVANAVATYQTKTIERAALANTNSFIKGQLANTNAYIAAQASRITLVNTNLLATNTALRSLISSQVSSVIGASPDALNTLQELANALGNNENFATATTNLISTKISVANTKAYLANTNAFIKTQLANTNLSIATRASWTALAGTNTALRTLVSDRLQVANAATIYQTKTIEREALANTNLRVNLINTNLTGTNTALRTLVSDRLQVANARSYMQVANVKSVLANTNAYIATKVNTTTFNAALANTNAYINSVVVSGGATWSSLSATNTALRTLISDRYQVANVNTLLAAKATWTGLTGTNTALRTLINDRLQVANASATYLTKNNPVVIGSLTANGSTGTAGYYLRTSGAGVYWSPVSASGAVTATSQTFTGDGTTTVFTLSSSISDSKNVIVSINGLIQTPVTHYSISGTTLTFTSAPYYNSNIEARSMEGVVISGGGGGGSASISSGDLFLGAMLLGGM